MSIKNNIKILKLDDKGRGIGYTENKIIFIPNSLPNEIVDIEIIKETSKYCEGRVVNYIKVSNERIKPVCSNFGLCGGCNLLHTEYKNTIDYKKNKVKNILKKFANLELDINIIENKNILYYRNKIDLKVEKGLWGYYNSNTHNFVSIDKCFLAKESINNIILNKNLINIKNGSIIIRSNYNDEILLSINSDEEVSVDINALKNITKLVGIVINDNIFYGESYFIEKYNDRVFKVNYNSFFQINEYITNQMINFLQENLNGNTLLDLYCGVGFLGQCVSDKFKKIYGIEINKSSIIDATNNARINNIDNTYYLCGDTSKVIDKIKDKIDVMIIDPPRTGLVKNMVDDVININASTLAYISCDPISLARDLNKLKEFYDIKKVFILDMFSYTYHIESIALLKKKNLI